MATCCNVWKPASPRVSAHNQLNLVSMKSQPRTIKSVIKRSLSIFLVATGMSGCESADMLFTVPGNFDYYSCTDITNTTKSTLKRQQELQELIDRAEQDTGGTLVAAAAYRTEYFKTRGDLKQLEEAARNKKCEPPKS
jgi:hypothetical protein